MRRRGGVAMSDDLEAVWSAYETQVDPEEVQQARDAAGHDEVVCFECAQTFGQITEQHLQTHSMALGEYQEEHPESPIYPADDARQPGREPGFCHPEKTKQKIGDSVRQQHERGVYE